MSDLAILRELIRKEARVAIENGIYGKKAVTLSEPGDGNHEGYSVVINNMPEDAVVIKTDCFPAPQKIFNNTKGECRRADFVIVARGNTENFIIFIEMKKGKGGPEKKIIQQLKGAQCVIDYCRSIGQVFWQQEDFLNPDTYKHRFVSIRDIGISKKPTRTLPSDGAHDRPEQMLKVMSPHRLHFRQLAGGKK